MDMEKMSVGNIVLVVVVGVAVSYLAIRLSNAIFKKVEKKNKSVALRFSNSIVNVGITLVMIAVVFSLIPNSESLGNRLFRSSSLALALFTFAAQKPLGNIISGIMLSASKPFAVGQKIRVLSGGSVIAEGIVTGMSMRQTIIEQYDGQSCIVPNSIIDESVIVNTNYTEGVGNFLEFEIGYYSNIDLARTIIKEACESEEGVMSCGNVLLNRFTENGVVLKIQVTSVDLNASFSACSDIREKVLREFHKNDIDIPYNTITVSESFRHQ